MAEQHRVEDEDVAVGDELDRGRKSEPLTREREESLRPRATVFRSGRGHPTAAYVEVVREVYETHEGRAHLERDFDGVSRTHVAGNLRRQAAKHGWPIAVANTPEDGVCAMYVGGDTLTN